MIFLPIVERELRVASRRHSTYAVRLVVALLAIAISVALYAAGVRVPSQVLAQEIFMGLAVLALIYCLAAGRRFTADCLSEEKRDGTLGLLFLTDLGGYDVVLGKLAATSLNGFYCLLAILPVLAMPLLLGGVSHGQFWRTVLVLVDSFLFSLAIGVLASVLTRDARQALGLNFLLALAFGAVPAAIGLAILYFSGGRWYAPAWFFSCPAYPFYLSDDSRYKFEVWHFWISVGLIHALTWGLTALASRLVPHCWQDQPTRAEKPRWSERWHAWVYGTGVRRKEFRTRLLNRNPFFWLAARARLKPVGVWAVFGFIGLWWLFVRFVLRFNWYDDLFSFTTALMVNSVIKLWIAIEAAQRLAEERKTGSLELLLSTPLRVRDLLGGQFLALRRQFLGPLVLCIVVQLSLVWGVHQLAYQMEHRALAFGVAGLVMLLADVATLPWVAMSAALTSRGPHQASLNTIVRVLILPWVVFGALAVTVAIWRSGAGKPEPGWQFHLNLWFWLGIVADLAFGLPCFFRLRTRFRELAMPGSVTNAPGAVPGESG